MRKIKNSSKNKHFNFRVNEQEYEKIKQKIVESKLSTSQYLLKSAMQKDITVIDGIGEITTELRRIGNNINQLTRLCNQGQITSLELKNVVKEVNNIWQLLNLLIQKQSSKQ